MNYTDVRLHHGTVTEAGHDLTLAVLVPSVSDEPLENVRPEAVTPVRWRPREGDDVVVVERVAPLRPDIGFTWLGWVHDEASGHLIPDWLDAGKVHLLSEDGRIVVLLEDEADPVALPSGGASPGEHLRLGRVDAAEPIMLGAVWRARDDDRLTQLVALIDATDVLFNAIAGALPPVAPAYATWKLAVVNSIGLGLAVRERLVGPTVPPGEDQRSTIDDTLSDFVFSAKAPGPEE